MPIAIGVPIVIKALTNIIGPNDEESGVSSLMLKLEKKKKKFILGAKNHVGEISYPVG